MTSMSNFCGSGDINKIYVVGGGGSGTGTDYYVTGGTYSNGTLILERQNGSVIISGFTTSDTYVTGFTYDNYILTISQNQGQSDLIVTLPTFITGYTDNYVTGGTYDSSTNTLTLDRQNGSIIITGFTSSYVFTGNTSGDCITDLFVSNLNSCSPLHIQNISNGNVLIGENGGVNIGIGNNSPTQIIDARGQGKQAIIGKAILGDWISGNTYAYFGNAALNQTGSGGIYNYALLQSNGGDTMINSSLGGTITIRENNATLFTFSKGTYGGKIDYFYGGPGSNVGVGVVGTSIQNYMTTSNTITFNVGGDPQPIGTNELMRIQGIDGNVGINNINPQAKLDIKGSGISSLGYGLKIQSSGGTNNFSVRDDGFVQGTGGGYNFFFGSSNAFIGGSNVGVGSLSDNTQFTVYGANYPQITFNANAYPTKVSLTSAYGGQYLLLTDNANPTKLTRLSSTNIGINLLSEPISAELEVNGKSKTTTLQITSGATTGYVLTSDASGNAFWSAPFSGVSTDYYVTGGTFDSGTNTLTLNRQNGSVVITGFTSSGGGSLTANTIFTDYIDFNQNYTGGTTQGRINWDSGTGTLNIGIGDSTTGLIDFQVGQEEVVRVFNGESTTLNKGEIVYVSSSQGNRPKVKRASAVSDGYSVTTLGMVDLAIPSGAEGYITTFGIISNLNTVGLTGGTPIWLSPISAGTYTTVKPIAPQHTVLIGYVVRVSATVGSIFVNISNGWELDEIHDVRISGATTGDLLMRSSFNGSNVWVNTKNLIGNYTISGNTNNIGSFSATTYYGDGSNLTGIVSTTDNFVTGGTFNSGTGTLTLNRQNGSVSVTGFTSGTGVDTYVTGFTYNTFNGQLTISQNQNQPDLTVTVSTPSSTSLFNYYNFI